jgi:hypothetical protein
MMLVVPESSSDAADHHLSNWASRAMFAEGQGYLDLRGNAGRPNRGDRGTKRAAHGLAGQMLAEMLEMLAQMLEQMLAQMLEPLRCWLRCLRCLRCLVQMLGQMLGH